MVIGLGLAYWFVSRLDWLTVGRHLQDAQIWPLILGAILINSTMLARSLRWQTFLAPICRVRLRNVFAATALGFGSIFVIGRAGEIVRPAMLSLRERMRPSATLATILIERIYDMAAVVSLFSINLLVFRPPSQTDYNWQRLGLLLFSGVVVGLVVLVVLRLKSAALIHWLERHSEKLPQKLVAPLLNFIKHLADGLSVLLNLRELGLTIFYTACVWGMVLAATWLTLYAFGLEFSVSQVIFILGFGLVGSVVPTPGGSAGAFHAAAAKGMEFLGLDPNLAASVALVYHLIAFGPPFVLGLYYAVRDEVSFKQLREMIAAEGESAPLNEPKARVSS
ncbi:MAG TPA: lysylphosphatidylglycerol synthase transmembrane domain-containing protein [Blastocatellia bacterium]|nr:lysylphosphatidylglycerol synthase transmembrane domain-containing protein [Blastocatellia bacterium]